MSDISLLSSFVQAFKSLTARRLKNLGLMTNLKQYNSTGSFRLWKRRFDDVIIVSEKQFRRKLQYIHDNPMKSGLVKNALDWEFSSARAWMNGEIGEIEIKKDFRWT